MSNNIIQQYIEIPDNLFALLTRYRVVIPGIQRHYVQGANNPKAESVRKQFIKEIFTAIEKSRVILICISSMVPSKQMEKIHLYPLMVSNA